MFDGLDLLLERFFLLGVLISDGGLSTVLMGNLHLLSKLLDLEVLVKIPILLQKVLTCLELVKDHCYLCALVIELVFNIPLNNLGVV